VHNSQSDPTLQSRQPLGRDKYRFTLLYSVCVFFFIQHIFLLDYCERGGVELLVSVLKLTAFIFCFNDAKMNEIDQD